MSRPPAVVFVIDSCHRDRLMEAHSELAKLLTEKELRDALLLIFANKQVRPENRSRFLGAVHFRAERLKPKSLLLYNKRHFNSSTVQDLS